MGRILKAHPTITLVADLSHFTCVAEAGHGDPELVRISMAVSK